jgi:addiction module HigA family antidote
MMSNIDYDWLPKHRRPTHPGAVLRDILKEHGLTQNEFADRLGIPRVRLNLVLNCKRSVTADTAMRLGKVLGTGPEVWLGMQHALDFWDALHGPKAKEIGRLRPLKGSAA